MAAPVRSVRATNFPDGASSYGFPLIGSGPYLTSGDVFFVDSTAASKGDDAAHGAEPFTPFATLDFAIGQCTADRGDLIFVLPGHAENIIAAGGINCDVAGVRIVGVTDVSGRARPTFTFATDVGASIQINAANVTIENLVLDCTGIDAVTNPIDVGAADFTLLNCEIITADAAGQCVDVIVTDANAHRMRVLGNFFNGSADSGTNSAILLRGTCDGVEIGWNRIVGHFSPGAGIFNSPAGAANGFTNAYIHDNIIYTRGSTQYGINILETTSSGLIVANKILVTDLTIALVNFNLAAVQNYGYDTDTSNTTGVEVPIVGSVLPQGQSLVDLIIGAEFSYNRARYIAVSVDLSSATWNTVATHEILTVTGAVRLKIIPVCSTDLTSGGAPTIQLGTETDTTAFIAATNVVDIDAGEFWLSATPAKQFAASSVVDRVVSGDDVGYELLVAAATGGIIVFHCWWEPINSTGAVVAGAGGTL